MNVRNLQHEKFLTGILSRKHALKFHLIKHGFITPFSYLNALVQLHNSNVNNKWVQFSSTISPETINGLGSAFNQFLTFNPPIKPNSMHLRPANPTQTLTFFQVMHLWVANPTPTQTLIKPTQLFSSAIGLPFKPNQPPTPNPNPTRLSPHQLLYPLNYIVHVWEV